MRSAKETIAAIFKQAQSLVPGRSRQSRATSSVQIEEQKRLLTELMLKKADVADRFAASFSQQSLWVVSQFGSLNSAHNLQIGVRLKGALDYDALKLSLQEIVNRHEVLRTKFALEDAQLFQIVAPDYVILLPVVDLSSVDESSRYIEAYELASQETQKQFDLAEGPLFRFQLIRLAPDDHVLNCVLDHIVSDGWSLGILIKELTSLYATFSSDQPSSLVPLPIQYRDYAQWQRGLIADGLFEPQIHYWKKKLKDAPPLLELSTGRRRPPQQTFIGSTQYLSVPTDVIRDLKSFSAKHDATLFMITFAAFQWLLSRYSGRKDIVVGVPVAGRNRWETEELLGLFVNTVVVRTDLSGNLRFRDLLIRVRALALEAFSNADIPFINLVEELKPTRNRSYNPIFQIMFAVIKSAVQSNTCASLNVTPYIVTSEHSAFDLTMNLIECAGEQWLMQVDYNSNLFDHEFIAQFLTDYVSSLRAIASQPDARLSDLERFDETGYAIEATT